MNVVAILEMFSLNILYGTTREAQWCPPSPSVTVQPLTWTAQVKGAQWHQLFVEEGLHGERKKVKRRRSVTYPPSPAALQTHGRTWWSWSHELAWRIMVNNYLWYTEHCLKRLKMTHNYPEALGYGGEFPWHCFTYKNGLRTIYDQQ